MPSAGPSRPNKHSSPARRSVFGIESNRQTLAKPLPAHVGYPSRQALDLYRQVAIDRGIIQKPEALFSSSPPRAEHSGSALNDLSDEYLSDSSSSDASFDSEGSSQSSDAPRSRPRRRRSRGSKVDHPRMASGLARLRQVAIYKDALENLTCHECQFRWFLSVEKQPVHFINSNLSAVALFTRRNPDEGMEFVEQLEGLSASPETLQCRVCEYISPLFEDNLPTLPSGSVVYEEGYDIEMDESFPTTSETTSALLQEQENYHPQRLVNDFRAPGRKTQHTDSTGLQRQDACFFNNGSTRAHRYDSGADASVLPRRASGGFQVGPIAEEGEFDSDSEYGFEDSWEASQRWDEEMEWESMNDDMGGLLIGDWA